MCQCKECLNYYPEYQFRYKEGMNYCTYKNREVNPEEKHPECFIIPVIPKNYD